MRIQSVCTNGIMSEHQPISFLTVLYIVYINDLPIVVLGWSVELYADDTLIYYGSNWASEIQTQFTAVLINVIGWLRADFLILNLDKTKMLS